MKFRTYIYLNVGDLPPAKAKEFLLERQEDYKKIATPVEEVFVIGTRGESYITHSLIPETAQEIENLD